MAVPFTPLPYIEVAGGVSVSTHGLFFLLGALAVRLIAPLRLDVAEYRRAERAIPWMLLGSAVGGRLFFILSHPETWSEPALWWRFWEGGMVSYGGFLGALLPLYLMTDRRTLDRLAAPLLLGWSIGRLGCLLSWYGEEGTPSRLPWAFLVGGVARHPVMLYLALALLLGSLLLWRRADGPLTLLYFGAARFLCDGFRDYQPDELLWASRGASLLLMLWALILLWKRRRVPAAPVESVRERTDLG